jgi:hypothetical protein
MTVFVVTRVGLMSRAIQNWVFADRKELMDFLIDTEGTWKADEFEDRALYYSFRNRDIESLRMDEFFPRFEFMANARRGETWSIAEKQIGKQ